MRLLEGAGSSLKGFTCPYHRWFFKLDGWLKIVPQQAALFPSLDRSKCGLRPASVGVFRGMVFVHPDESPAENFNSFLADLDAKIGPHRPDGMVEIARQRFEFRANWKIVVENYMDSYHLFYLHERTLPMFDHKELEWRAAGRHVLVYEPVHRKYKDWLSLTYGVTAGGCVPGVDPECYGGEFHMLFPNIGWAAMAHTWSTFHAVPMAADRTMVESRTRATPAALEQMKKAPRFADRFRGGGKIFTLEDSETHPLQSNDSMLEDMWACEQMQKGLASPAARIGPLARKYESMLAFHQRNLLDFVNYLK
jgi:Rieske 2Fe-2S family protein